MFKVGDKVVVVNQSSIFTGRTATVVEVRSPEYDGYDSIGVRLDLEKPISSLHSCGGRCEKGYGFYFRPRSLEVIEEINLSSALVAELF